MSTHYSRRTAIQRGLLAAGSIGVGWPTLAQVSPALAHTGSQLAGSTPPAANLGFAFRLFGQLAGAGNKNTFLSPLSVSLALAMTANGARGATQQAILSTLNLGQMTVADLNRQSAALIAALGARDSQVQLAIADSLWTRMGLTVQPQFAQTLKNVYQAQLTSLNFADPGAPATINSWVSHATRGLIPSIVNSIPPQAILYLINALYFKADWTLKFPTRATRQQPFSLPGGQQAQVPMMNNHGMFHYYEDTRQQVIRLPYGSGKFSMYILLPKADVDFATYQRSLTPQSWSAVLGGLTTAEGSIALPRFTVSYAANLIPALSVLGMGVAFGPRADLGGIFADTQAMISAVLHKAVMKVYEAGTTAAAVTAVIGIALAMPHSFSMTVDRPFFCAIRDDTTGTLLFMGAIVDPRS